MNSEMHHRVEDELMIYFLSSQRYDKEDINKSLLLQTIHTQFWPRTVVSRIKDVGAGF